jgi:acetylglutamate kinase
VLDDAGRSIPALDVEAVDAMIARGSATAGMVAKLMACRTALADGVRSVRILDGRSLTSARDLDQAPGTAIVVGERTLGNT